MSISATKQTLEEKIDEYFANFDALLKNTDMDHSKIMAEAHNIVILLMHSGANADKSYASDREEEIWVRVHEVKGTFNSKTVLILTVVSASLTILSGFVGLASVVPGTSLGNTLIGKGFTFLNGGLETGKKIKSVSDAIGQFGQGSGLFPKIAEDVNQSERVEYNAYLDEAKQKRQDRVDSRQRHTSQKDRAMQHARENEQKQSQIKSEIMRG